MTNHIVIHMEKKLKKKIYIYIYNEKKYLIINIYITN